MEAKTLGTMASGLQMALIFGGMPHQIYMILSNQSAHELSIPKWIITVLSCVVWLAFGVKTENKYVYFPQIPATIFSVVIITLCLVYG